MANSPFAKLSLSIVGADAISGGLRNGTLPIPIQEVLNLTNGVNDGQIDRLYYKQETGMPASTVNSYDLAGSLTDAEGTTITFAEVCLLFVRNRRTTALAYLDVGPHATAGFGRLASSKGFWPADAAADADQGNIVGPGSFMLLYDKVGVPVTATTIDILRITTSGVSGSTNAWDLLILGRS